jgi:beta-hydroxylase
MDTAFFSILPPRIHLERHRGPFNGWLRYHLGLIVPQQASACRIQVGDETNHWNEGKSLIFDDSYFHEVWNDTDEQRVVLFVDFARPLRAPASMLNAAHRRVAHYIGYSQKAMQNLKTWTKGSGKDAR